MNEKEARRARRKAKRKKGSGRYAVAYDHLDYECRQNPRTYGPTTSERVYEFARRACRDEADDDVFALATENAFQRIAREGNEFNKAFGDPALNTKKHRANIVGVSIVAAVAIIATLVAYYL